MKLEQVLKLKVNKRCFSRYCVSAIFIFLFISIYGCEGSYSKQDLEIFVQQTKSRVKNKIESLPEEKKAKDYRYYGLVKRSPFITAEDFVSSQVDGLDNTNKPDMARAKEVLESYDIQNLKMVGSIRKNDGSYWALVKDNSNKVHKLKVGNYVGKNYGRVTQVTDQDIEINEYISNSFGGWKTKTVIMTLQE